MTKRDAAALRASAARLELAAAKLRRLADRIDPPKRARAKAAVKTKRAAKRPARRGRRR